MESLVLNVQSKFLDKNSNKYNKMNLVLMIFDMIALFLVATLIFVDEKHYTYLKFAIAVVICLSIVYNIAFLCGCVRRFAPWGDSFFNRFRCPNKGQPKKPVGTGMKPMGRPMVERPVRRPLATRENLRGFTEMRE